MIELTNVHKRFGQQVVLDGVDFTVKDGETVALLGPSGCGKSVLLKHIVGLIRQDSGMVMVDGKEVAQLKREELRALRSTIGYVFQNGALFDSMNVFENIRLGITNEDQFRDMDYCQERVARCLKLVNLTPETAEQVPGAALRAACGSGWASRAPSPGTPKYLLYDEPTSGLDPVNSDIIDDLVKSLAAELGVTSVMVTHDVRGSFRVADRLALLTGGKIVQQGTPKEFMESTVPEVREFLERDFGNLNFAA